MIKVTHSSGATEKFDGVEEAIDALKSVYGNDIVIDDIDNIIYGRALVWQDEAASINDDGVNAVAQIKHLVFE